MRHPARSKWALASARPSAHHPFPERLLPCHECQPRPPPPVMLYRFQAVLPFPRFPLPSGTSKCTIRDCQRVSKKNGMALALGDASRRREREGMGVEEESGTLSSEDLPPAPARTVLTATSTPTGAALPSPWLRRLPMGSECAWLDSLEGQGCSAEPGCCFGEGPCGEREVGGMDAIDVELLAVGDGITNVGRAPVRRIFEAAMWVSGGSAKPPHALTA